ncbi:TBC1 domain family member 2B, partial [Biomphalaria pfeifferi]
VDGKEIQLTAENHESMMIWLMALQARRDQFALAEKSRTSSTSTENDFDLDLNFLEVVESRERSASDLSIVRTTTELKPTPMHQPRAHKPLEATQSLQGQSLVATVGFLGLSPDWRRNQLKKMGDTIDNSHPSAKIFEKDRSLSLPPLLEESALSHLHSGSRQLSMSMRAQRMTQNDVIWSTQSSSSSTDNSDDLYMSSGHQSVSRSASDKDSETIASIAPQEETSQAEVPDDDGRVSDLEKELIATKCELAKVLNKQSCFQEILKQKDEIIEDLDEKLGNRSFNSEGYDSKKRGTAVNKEHQERVRVLQNQNRFLNEEVRRLAKLRSQEHDKIKIQESKVRKLEADIEVWKLEYISLIQSSIRFTGTDTMDDAELSLYGGDRHKNRIISLLEEARKINPSLPTFELLSRGEVHVDTYGFKHHFSDEGLLLHYLCQELSQHFLCQANSYEKHQRNWLQYLKSNTKQLMANKKTLKALVRNGIPDVHRKTMWKAFVMAQVEDIIIEKGAHYFRSLCNSVPDSPLAARYRKQISLDLMRTMPTNVKFSTQGCKGIMDLQDVLLAFCIHNPHVGYCQGMNFLVAMALLFMDAQDAFWTLVAVTERYHSPSYFDHNLLGAQADQAVLHDLMSEKLSELAKHLDAIDIEISTVTLNWFLALFFDAVPFPVSSLKTKHQLIFLDTLF